MTSQLNTTQPLPGRSPLSSWLLRDRAPSTRGRIGWPILRIRRELDELRITVRELEYIQQSLLGTVDRLVEMSSIILERHTDDATSIPK
jgi:hypothetical protein